MKSINRLLIIILFIVGAYLLYLKLNSVEIKTFPREGFDRLVAKVSKKQRLVVHVFLPLCDNENQGIVPVPKKFGNGFDLKNNLYWGAMYGLKSYFKKSKSWKLIYSKKDISKSVLERVVFQKDNLYLVADAYRGDKMRESLMDYFDATSGFKSGEVALNGLSLPLYKDADLTVFNGHDGLMDYNIKSKLNRDNRTRESVAIACKSYPYFKENLSRSKAYPLITTNGELAPEAYVLEAIVESWSRLESVKMMKRNAGRAYNRYQKCGLKGATNLFQAGWKSEDERR